MVNAARSLQCYYWILIKVNKQVKYIIHEPQYLYVLRHHKLSISPGVLLFYTNHVTPRKGKHRGFICKY
jgi:hypothetical protein